MGYTPAQFRSKVSEIVQDKAEKLSALEIDHFIQEAVKIYSRHRPRRVVKDITGTGNYDYAILTNLQAWDRGFSEIKSIEYPAGQREPVYLEENEWMIYEKEDGPYLRFLTAAPSTTETIRVVYTALHVLSETQNTIPESDQDALCNLAASLCSGALASYYAQTADATIGADSVNYRTKSQEYTARAKEQKRVYLEHIGIKESGPAPASAFGADLIESRRKGRLTH